MFVTRKNRNKKNQLPILKAQIIVESVWLYVCMYVFVCVHVYTYVYVFQTVLDVPQAGLEPLILLPVS